MESSSTKDASTGAQDRYILFGDPVPGKKKD
jgi:hypothetical protein